jgi:ribosome-associated protein
MLQPQVVSQASDVSTIVVLNQIVESCTEAKGSDIVVLDMNSVGALTDYFVVVTGRSDRQVQGIANRVLENLEERGVSPISIDGMEQGHWVILDYGDIVLHVFYGPERERYDLEGLWVKAGKFVVEETSAGIRLKAA